MVPGFVALPQVHMAIYHFIKKQREKQVQRKGLQSLLPQASISTFHISCLFVLACGILGDIGKCTQGVEIKWRMHGLTITCIRP